MFFPLLYPAFIAVFFDIPVGKLVTVLLSPVFYLLSAVVVAAGYGLWEMHRWGWYVFLFASGLIVYENAVMVTNYGETHHKVVSFVLSVLPLILLVYRIYREIFVPYFMPRIRWWESNTKYRIYIPVQMKLEDGSQLDGRILDLSLKGCFIKLPMQIRANAPVNLTFKVFGQDIECYGRAVWITSSTVTLPRGAGVKFFKLPRPVKARLKTVAARLHKLSNLYRRERNQDQQKEFLQLLDELQYAPSTTKAEAKSETKPDSKDDVSSGQS